MQKHKVLFGHDYSNSEMLKFLLYLFIGGTAALLEWALFYFFRYSLNIFYLYATATAFLLATVYHYILGNILVFSSGARYGKKSEFALVLAVSVIGLVFNLGLMYLFVGISGQNAFLSKVLASAIVFFWNYLSRKYWIFKEDV